MRGMRSNGTLPCHSCAPVQPGTGSQPLILGRTGTMARTRWPMRPVVSAATTLWSIRPQPRAASKKLSTPFAFSIGRRQASDRSVSAYCTERRLSAAPVAASPAITGPWCVETTSTVTAAPPRTAIVSRRRVVGRHSPLNS